MDNEPTTTSATEETPVATEENLKTEGGQPAEEVSTTDIVDSMPESNEALKEEEQLTDEEKKEMAEIDKNRLIVKDLCKKWFAELIATDLPTGYIPELIAMFRTYVGMVLPRSDEYNAFLDAKKKYEETPLNKITLNEKDIDENQIFDSTDNV